MTEAPHSWDLHVENRQYKASVENRDEHQENIESLKGILEQDTKQTK
jgi:hypothetical protein